MRTREKGFADYGFTKAEAKALKKYCNSREFSERDLLLAAALSTNSDIADVLYYSIVGGISYENAFLLKDVPIGKNDFYGYQRKCIAAFRESLIMCGKWKSE